MSICDEIIVMDRNIAVDRPQNYIPTKQLVRSEILGNPPINVTEAVKDKNPH